MSIPFTCPHCKQSFKAQNQFAGQIVHCPNKDCKQKVLVPMPAPARVPVGPGQDTPPPAKLPPPAARSADSGPRPAVPSKPTANGNGSASTKSLTPGETAAPPAPKNPITPAKPPAAVQPPAPPVTAPPPAEMSADEIAAAAFAATDEPKPAEVVPQTTVAVKCEYCDHEFTVASSLAGKNTICPECRKRIKVPTLKVEKPKDWRVTDDGKPQGARRDQEKLDGAWDIGTKQVGGDVLRQVGATVPDDDPITWTERLVQLTKIALAASVVVGAVWFGWTWYVAWTTVGVMERAIAFVTDKNNSAQLVPIQKAGVWRLAGDFEARQGRHKKSLEAYQQARGAVAAAGDGAERDRLVLDVAEGTAGLFGAPVVPPDGSPVTWSWDEQYVQKNLRQTLDMLARPGQEENRAEIVRRLTRRLAKTPALDRWRELARGLGTNAEERADVQGLIGLELLSAGVSDGAKAAADQGLKDFAEAVTAAAGKPPAPTPRLLALLVALDFPPAVRGKLAPEPGPAQTLLTRAGYVEGWARAGKADDARKLAASPVSGVGPSEEANRRAESFADLAEATLAVGGKDTAALKDIATEVVANKDVDYAPGTLYRLARLAGRAGDAELASQFAARLRIRPDYRAAAQLEALRAKLATALAERKKADPKWAEEVDAAGPLSRGLAVAAVTEHNAELGDSNASKAANAATVPAMKPFCYAGVALALQPGAH